MNALNNAQIDGIPILTSGLDSQALDYEVQGKIEMINGDFWIAGYFSAILMEAYLHGNQILDEEGNVPLIDDIMPFEVKPEQYDLYKAVFLDNPVYTQEETQALVNGTYEDFINAVYSYNLEERAAARVADGTIDASLVEAAGITLE